MLDLELGTHGELDALLDLEGVVLEGLLRAGGGKVDGDGVTAGRAHRQGEDDALAGVVGVRDALSTSPESKRLLVTLERLVFGI